MRKVIADLSPGRAYTVQIRSTAGDSFSEWSPNFTIGPYNKVALPPEIVSSDIVISTIDDKFFANWTYGAIQNDFNNYEYKWAYWNGTEYVDSTTVYSTLLAPGIFTSSNINLPLTSQTVSVTDASTLPTSGTVYIAGTAVAYTSKSGNDLVGCTASGTGTLTAPQGVVTTLSGNPSSGNAELDYATNLKLFTPARPNISISVRTVDTTGNKSGWVRSANFATNPAPGKPMSVSLSGSTDTISATWLAPSTDKDLKSYNIYVYRASTPSIVDQVVKATHIESTSSLAQSAQISFTDTEARKIKIKSVDKFDQESAESDNTVLVAATAPNIENDLKTAIQSWSRDAGGTVTIQTVTPHGLKIYSPQSISAVSASVSGVRTITLSSSPVFSVTDRVEITGLTTASLNENVVVLSILGNTFTYKSSDTDSAAIPIAAIPGAGNNPLVLASDWVMISDSINVDGDDCNTLEGAPVKIVSVASGVDPVVFTCIPDPAKLNSIKSGSTGYVSHTGNIVKINKGSINVGNLESHNLVAIYPTSFTLRSGFEGQRIAITSAGITGYRTGNDPTVRIGNDGTFFLKSSVSGNRVELDGDNGLRVKDSYNNTIVKVDTTGLEGYSKPIPISSISAMSASISSITSSSGATYSTPVTYASSNEGSFTYTAGNIFTAGQTVNITGFSNTAYNLSNAVVSGSDGSTFTVGAGLVTYPITAYSTIAEDGTVTFTVSGSFVLAEGDLVSISDSITGYNLKNASVLSTTATTFTLSFPGAPDTGSTATSGTVYKLEKSESPTSATASYPGSTYIKTVTTSPAHNFPVGSLVTVGVDVNAPILSSPTATTFTYLSLSSNVLYSDPAYINGYRKLVTGADHGLKPGQLFRITGTTTGMDEEPVEVSDVISNNTLTYKTLKGGTSSTGQIAKETFSININNGASSFGGEIKSSSYSTYSLTGSKLSISENDGLKLTRETVQNFILNPTFSNNVDSPYSEHWESVASYGQPVVNSGQSDSGMGQLAGVNSFKSSPIKITSITDTNNSLEKTVTTSVNHGLAVPDRVALNGIVYGSITPSSINYKETVSSVSSLDSGATYTVFKYTPEIGKNAFYITSITTSGTTKTVNTDVAHNFVVGQKVWITGTSNSNLNNRSVTILLTPTTTSFTYTLTGDSTSTASDTVTTVTAATKVSGTYTFTSANNYSPGETVTISGVNSNYNITGTIVTANGTQFTMSGSGSASAWNKVVSVTSAIGFSNSVSFTTTDNAFQSGDTVTIAKLPTGFNLNNVTIASAGANSFTVNTNTLSGQSWSNTSKVSGATSDGTVVTYAVPLGHGITYGSTVSITGTSSAFNLSGWAVTGTGATSFSITPMSAPAAGVWDNTWRISSAEISAGQIQYTTTSAHQLTAGGLATVSYASGSYNITDVAITAASGTTFTASTANSAVAWKNTLRIESATGNGSVITYTTSNPHGFYNGQYVTVSGLNASYNVSGTISGASGNVFSISSTATTSPTSWQRALYPAAWSYSSPNLTLTVPNLFPDGNYVAVDGLPTSASAYATIYNMATDLTSDATKIVLNIGTTTLSAVTTKTISYKPTATASTTYTGVSVNLSSLAGSATLNVSSATSFPAATVSSPQTVYVYATPTAPLSPKFYPITYTGKTAGTLTGCNSGGATATLANGAEVVISTNNLSSITSSSNTTIPASSITGWPTTGFFNIVDSTGTSRLISYGSISGLSFINCNLLDSSVSTIAVNAYANISQQPRIILNGITSTRQSGSTVSTVYISSASYVASTGLRTYVTSAAHGLVAGDTVNVSNVTGADSAEYNIIEGTIKSVTTSTPHTFVVYAPSPSSAGSGSLAGLTAGYTSHASKVLAYADVIVTGKSTNNGTATVSGGTASTTAAVGTASPSGASATFTNSSISSFSSSRRGALTTPVYLPNSASKAATGSFWIYQNVETSGLYLNMKDFILDDSTTPIPASTNNTTFSQIIPKGSWTRISNIFNLPSLWGPSSTLKLPTLLYADKSFSVTNISGTGIGSRTVTTSDNHNFEQYQTVTISGAAPGFNETATIVTIPSPNTFTYNSNVSGSHSTAYFPKATSKSVQVNAVAYYDGTMLTLTNGLTEYFDGDHQGKWQGVKGDSVSVKESFTSGQIRLRAGSNISAGEGNYLSEMDKISFSSALPQKVSPSIAPISLDIYDSILGYLPPQTGVALYSGSDTVGKSAYVGVTTDGTTGILTLGGISKIQGNPYFTDVRTVYRQGSKTVYNTSGTYAFLNYGSPATYFGNIPFTVPASGQCIIDYGSNYYLVSSANAGASIYLALSISTTINAGVTVLWDERTDTGAGAASSRVLVAQIDTSSTSSINTAVRSSFSRRHVFYGTPGQTYYAQLSSKGSGGTYEITIPQIIITPVLAKI